jgi:hypothetical protein
MKRWICRSDFRSRHDMSMRPTLARVTAKLAGVFDGWHLCCWLVTRIARSTTKRRSMCWRKMRVRSGGRRASTAPRLRLSRDEIFVDARLFYSGLE